MTTFPPMKRRNGKAIESLARFGPFWMSAIRRRFLTKSFPRHFQKPRRAVLSPGRTLNVIATNCLSFFSLAANLSETTPDNTPLLPPSASSWKRGSKPSQQPKKLIYNACAGKCLLTACSFLCGASRRGF